MNKIFIKYLLRRVFFIFLTLFLIVTITFLLLNFLPGTPYTNEEQMTDAQIMIMNERYGLNEPLIIRYFRYIFNILRGDFGISFQFNNIPVSQILSTRIGTTIQLGAQGILLGALFGIILGVIAAMYRATWLDHSATFIAIIGRSVPNFVFAVLLQQLFALNVQWFPIIWDGSLHSSILPTVALAIAPLADTSRFVRTEMVEVLNSDYIELAEAKGLGRNAIAFKHGVRNALIPIITILGPLAASLMTGSMVIENIYAIPGVGELFVQSILTNDYQIIMAITIFYSGLLCSVLLLVDILYGLIDPRIRIDE
jgi:oligopeptide transport system permease protein